MLIAIILSISIASACFHLSLVELFVHGDNQIDKVIEIIWSFYPCKFVFDAVPESVVVASDECCIVPSGFKGMSSKCCRILGCWSRLSKLLQLSNGNSLFIAAPIKLFQSLFELYVVRKQYFSLLSSSFSFIQISDKQYKLIYYQSSEVASYKQNLFYRAFKVFSFQNKVKLILYQKSLKILSSS